MALDTLANLARAHKALGELIAAYGKRDCDHEWAALYDALQYVPGIEDAASDALGDALADMGLDSEGFPLQDLMGSNCNAARGYVPMTAIHMPQVSA